MERAATRNVEAGPSSLGGAPEAAAWWPPQSRPGERRARGVPASPESVARGGPGWWQGARRRAGAASGGVRRIPRAPEAGAAASGGAQASSGGRRAARGSSSRRAHGARWPAAEKSSVVQYDMMDDNSQ